MTLFNEKKQIKSLKFSELLSTYINLREEIRAIYQRNVAVSFEISQKIGEDCNALLREMDLRMEKVQ